MMLSDYLALSTCAISILIVPFLVIAQMRFTHIMQTQNYSNKDYFLYIKKSFKLVYIPPILIFVICILNNVAIKLYLQYNTFYEMGVIIGFLLLVAVVCAIIAVVFYIYIKTIKIESEKKPLEITSKFIGVFVFSCGIIAVLAVIENVFVSLDYITYILPLLAPLLVPLTNLLTGKHMGNRAKLEER